ncbi:MAG: THUMP domain-containing protein [Tannerella sp.]|jgi:putative N6-adenine-specific DNA methylase|nr:THUMP domain-containing protein [Tannerella sp.]
MTKDKFEMIAKTLFGLEDVLAEELKAIGAEEITNGKRMVSFTGDERMLYKANFQCRTALRILKPILHFKAYNSDNVYNEVKKIEWDNYLSLSDTFTIDAVIFSESFNHSKFVAYKTKDAIADYFNEKYGKRPSVSVKSPDFYINVHISHNDCTVSLDSSGESLHRRGYRIDQGEAPLNEVLAAGMILKTGWRGESNFIDPFCGSGTLLIEAAMIALNIAPGVYRKHYAFEKWKDFDSELFDEIYNDDSDEKNFDFKCFGSDISPKAIEKARENVKSAGFTKYIELTVKPFQQFTEVIQPGILVTNPPYGERISTDDLLGLYGTIGERLKHVFMRYDAWILSYKDEFFEKIGLRPKEKIKLMNGELECEFHCYELFEGKNRDFKKEREEAKVPFRGFRGRDEGEKGRKDEREKGRKFEGVKGDQVSFRGFRGRDEGRRHDVETHYSDSTVRKYDSKSEEKELQQERSERHNRLAARHNGIEEKASRTKNRDGTSTNRLKETINKKIIPLKKK